MGGGGGGGGGGEGGGEGIRGGDGANGGDVAQMANLPDAAGSSGRLGASLTRPGVPGADADTSLYPATTPSANADGAGSVGLLAAPVAWRAADRGSTSSAGGGEEPAGIGGVEGGTAGSVSADGTTTGGRGGPALDASGDEDDFMSMDPPDVSVFKHAAW